MLLLLSIKPFILSLWFQLFSNHSALSPFTCRGSSWIWSYGSWMYNYLCNQCLSPLTLWIQIPCRRGVLDTLCDKVCQRLAAGLLITRVTWWVLLMEQELLTPLFILSDYPFGTFKLRDREKVIWSFKLYIFSSNTKDQSINQGYH
jgi:hypothetical protein